MTSVRSDEVGISLSGALTVHTIGPLMPQVRTLIAAHPRPSFKVEWQGVIQLDTSGAGFLQSLPTWLFKTALPITLLKSIGTNP